MEYYRTRNEFLQSMLLAHISTNEHMPLIPLRTTSTLLYITQSHLKIFYFVKSKLLYMGKFYHVEVKAIKKEQLNSVKSYIFLKTYLYIDLKKKRTW